MASEQGLNLAGWIAVALGAVFGVLVLGAVVLLLGLGARWLLRRRA